MSRVAQRAWHRNPVAWLLAAAAIVGLALLLPRMRSRHGATAQVSVEKVARQDIAVTVEATGTVEPMDLVEIKSKASGLIVRMPVEVGSRVEAGDLLAQVDPTNVRNQFDQAQAALDAAQARFDISSAQRRRSDDLFAQQVITAGEHESAVLDHANAQAALVTARTNLELARQARDDATVRAPIAGTVLSQAVTAGTVISSATLTVGGGTTLLTMADLQRIRLRALVSESDIGNVRLGRPAAVTVDAYPQRPFQGTVEKIEPQAVVQQSVTMFPVLVSIANEQGLLLPGMNGEVSVLVDERADALALPVDAVRSAREIPAVAAALGLDADSVRVGVERQIAARVRDTRRDAAGAAAGAGTAFDGASRRARRDSARVAGGGSSGGAGRGRGARGEWRGRGSGAERDSMPGRGGFGSGAEAGGRGAATPGAGASAAPGSGGGFAAGAAGRAARAGRVQVAFVRTARGLEPRVVQLGISNFDYAEVLSGVEEGEEVVLLSVAELQARRAETQSRIRQRMGSGLPGAGAGGGRGAGGR